MSKTVAQPPLNRSTKPSLVNRLTLRPLKRKQPTFVAPVNPKNTMNLPQSTSSTDSNKENAVEPSNNIQTVDKSKRNRIFFTPSDEESSQNSPTQGKPTKKLPFKLNLGTLKTNSQRSTSQQQANETNHLTNTFGSAAKTGCTPVLFPSSGRTPQNLADQDLSCLDDLEF